MLSMVGFHKGILLPPSNMGPSLLNDLPNVVVFLSVSLKTGQKGYPSKNDRPIWCVATS